MEYRDGLGQGWRVGAKALERMIDESSGDAHRWLDALLDLRDARTTLDATRAKLAECEQKAESYDLTHTGDWFERAHALGQRDPAKYAGRDIWHVAVEMAESLAEVERERHREHEARVQMEHELSEAGCATVADLVRERDEARDKRAHETQHLLNCCAERDKALAASQAECARLRELLSAGWCRNCTYERGHADRVQAAIASAPGSTDALREVVAAALAVQREISTQQYGVALSEGSISAIVSRILGERSDDAPQGRGERGKEGGDA